MQVLPRFSIRTLMAFMVLAAIVAWVLSQAMVDAIWAQCVGWTLLFLVALFTVHMTTFLIAYVLSVMLGIVSKPAKTGVTFWSTENRATASGDA